MTTQSETRAGKLRDIAFAIMNTAESSDECADKVLVDRSLVGQLREALAASEPGDSGCDDLVSPLNLARIDAAVKRQASTSCTLDHPDDWPCPICNTPAPEQPGKGEAAWNDANVLRAKLHIAHEVVEILKSRHGVSDGDIDAAALLAQRERKDWPGEDYWRQFYAPLVSLYATPQPSDPAEGDALTFDQWFTNNWPKTEKDAEAGVTNACSVKMVARDAWEAALSTPPTAAVRVDTNDILFVGFDKNMEKRLFHLRDTAERHCIGDIKTYAALDPQVKKQD